MFIIKSNVSLLLRQPRISFFLSFANYYGGNHSQYDPQQNRDRRSGGGYGDQKAYYLQDLRNSKRVSGDMQLYFLNSLS